MSARQPFRPTSRPESQPSSSQSDAKAFHSQRMDSDLGNTVNKSFNLSGLFNPKKRDQSLLSRKSKPQDDQQVPPQSIPSNSWSAGPSTTRLDLSPAPAPALPSVVSSLGAASIYRSSGVPSAQADDIPSSPTVENGNTVSSFFVQEASSQHLLPMINEADEDTETSNAPGTGLVPHFFSGRYAEGPSSRKRTQRMDEGTAEIDCVKAKRFKQEPPKQLSGSTVRSRSSSYIHTAPVEQLDMSRHELDTILGFDSDAYISENLKKYEDLKEKWANSSMEEWKAGAQEISEKFSGVLDMVKDHMTQKMSLYADIQAKIDGHKNILDERSKELVEAKRDLVKRSGNVIGQED